MALIIQHYSESSCESTLAEHFKGYNISMNSACTCTETHTGQSGEWVRIPPLEGLCAGRWHHQMTWWDQGLSMHVHTHTHTHTTTHTPSHKEQSNPAGPWGCLWESGWEQDKQCDGMSKGSWQMRGPLARINVYPNRSSSSGSGQPCSSVVTENRTPAHGGWWASLGLVTRVVQRACSICILYRLSHNLFPCLCLL